MKLRAPALAASLVVLVGLAVAALRDHRGPFFAVWPLAYLGAQGVASMARARRARRAAAGHDQAEMSAVGSPLRAGPCVLEGEVQYAEGASSAMRVEFEQVGTESESSGSWSHKWTEVQRTLTVQPFYLVRRDGERLRVEPERDRSRLCDELENKVLVRNDRPGPGREGPRRVRFATLVPHERVWITGQLVRGVDPERAGVAVQAGYRESAQPTSWIVRGAPTLLVSSVSLAAHFAQRAAQHVRHATFYFVCMLAPLALLACYVDRANGETVTAKVESVHEVTNDDGHVTGYSVTASHAHGTVKSEPLPAAPSLGAPMLFRVGRFSENVGERAQYTSNEVQGCLALAVGALLLSCIATMMITSSLPWYRSPRIKVEDSGQGRLPV